MVFPPQPAKAVPPFLNVMVFIDGGYLRNGYRKLVGHESIRFSGLIEDPISYNFGIDETKGEIVRIYYYDAKVDASDNLKMSKKQEVLFHNIGLLPKFEVRLGRLVKTGSGDYRQKGVDILIAIDMLAKAFQNFYDIAVFIGGDDDFVDLIKTIKGLTNKRIYGMVFSHNVSKRLLESFDSSYFINKDICNNYTDMRALSEK